MIPIDCHFPYYKKIPHGFSLDVGARNHRHFCAVNYNKTPGFEVSDGNTINLGTGYCSSTHSVTLTFTVPVRITFTCFVCFCCCFFFNYFL